MNRKTLLCLLSIVLLIGAAPAQELETELATPAKPSQGGFWAMGGAYGGLFGFDNLNARLAGYRFNKQLTGTHLMFGGGGLALNGHITTAGFGFGGEQKLRSEALNINLGVEYAGGMFELGWMPVTTANFMFGPALGIGGAGFAIRAAHTSSYVPNFDSMLMHGAQAWEIDNSRLTLAPALNILIPIKFTGIALKVGYFWAPFEDDWKMGSFDLANAPTLAASGPFAALQLMLGSSDQTSTADRQRREELKAAEERRKEMQRLEELKREQEEQQRREAELKRQQEQLNEQQRQTEEEKKREEERLREEERKREEEKKREEEGRK